MLVCVISAITITLTKAKYKTTESMCKVATEISGIENASKDNNVTIEYIDGKVNFKGISKNNTRCYLYFDKEVLITVNDIIATNNPKSETPNFTTTATTDEGMYRVSDGMYGGISYYWRGAATTNHMILDNKCWRIVRINGDKTIRLIYNGTPTNNTCPGNGTNSSSVILQNTAYNSSRDNSSHVGWTYTVGSQRPSTSNPQTTGESASLKIVLENWYNDNILDKSKLTTGQFCNDRNVGSGSYSGNGSSFTYAAHSRLTNGTKAPSLSCSNGDIYQLNIGMITADEAQFAGASAELSNTSYYLYNGEYYWTMSPGQWYYRDDGIYGADVFVVYNTGAIIIGRVHQTIYGVRPVINLRSDVTFMGTGTQSNPYVVK